MSRSAVPIAGGSLPRTPWDIFVKMKEGRHV